MCLQANRLHLTSLINRVNQIEGHEVKDAVKPSEGPMSYFTQYKRVHDKLGHLRGPGAKKEYPVREEYDILTGRVHGVFWM